MSQADRTANHVRNLFHPVSHYESPSDVLNDAKLSANEKRVILSSWASDMYAVESRPALREVPGIPRRFRLDDILAALKKLDDDTDPPPRGGLAMRLPRFSKLDCRASGQPRGSSTDLQGAEHCRSLQALRIRSSSRWNREANVRRYRRLLGTQLTDVERSFIERRLAEELRG